MADIVMPQLGETVTEGTITKWFKNIGDRVERDELLFEVSTDKVDSEVSSSAAGILTEIRVPEGETVDVGSVLAVVGDGAAAAIAPAAPAPAVEAAAPPVVEVAAPPAPGVAPPVAAPVAVAAPPAPAPSLPPTAPTAAAAPVPVAAPGGDPAPASGTAIQGPVSSAGEADSMAKVLSPVVRKLLNEHRIDPATITGTGTGGRITREDVLAIIDQNDGSATRSSSAAAPSPAAPPAAPVPPAGASAAPEPVPSGPAAAVTSAEAPAPPPIIEAPGAAPSTSTVAARPSSPVTAPAVRVGPRDEVVTFNNIRRRTGEHMLNSLATAPHAFIAVEVDFSAVDRHRAKAKVNFKAEEGFSLTYLPFIARAVVDALRTYPNVNASVSEGSLVVHHSVNLGVAVDLDFQGLMVPVVRDADGKRLRAIARDIVDLAARARSKKLMPDDIAGGTFTISNAGPYGIDLMQSIINQPQVAILSVTSVKKKPVVLELPDGSDTIAIHPMGMLGLSWDHRGFDGAYAASFLHEVRAQLEGKDWASEL